jgi:hypothetical protein
MDRVWTFQELVLAQKLYFMKGDFCLLQFSGTDLNLIGPLQITPITPGMRDIYRLLRDQAQSLNFSLRKINIGDVGRETRWWTTSKRADELLAVSVLLKINVDKIQKIKNEEQRMAEFLIMLKRLPRNLIFMDVPRLNLKAFRWAPRTFLTTDARKLSSDLDAEGVSCTSSGSVGEYLTFTPHPPQIIKYIPTTRLTITENTLFGEPGRFDVWDLNNLESFQFSHVILFPTELPPSVYGTLPTYRCCCSGRKVLICSAIKGVGFWPAYRLGLLVRKSRIFGVLSPFFHTTEG